MRGSPSPLSARAISASAEHRCRFGLAPKPPNAARQAAMCGWSDGRARPAQRFSAAASAADAGRVGRPVHQPRGDDHARAVAGIRGSDARVDDELERAQSASCWYAIDWNDSRCSGDTPRRSIAARCSGVE